MLSLRHTTLAFAAIAALAVAPSAEATPATKEGLEFFEKNVRPILIDRCYECHSAEKNSSKGGLILDSMDGAYKGGDEGPSAHDLLNSSREASALHRCLDTLDGRQRQSISVAYFQGLSCAELAEHLAAPLGSVKSWIRRGMERLRRCLES